MPGVLVEGFLRFGVGADLLEGALSDGAMALCADGEHDDAVLDLEAQGRRIGGAVDGTQRHPAAHFLTDRGDDALDADRLPFEVGRPRQHVRDRRRLFNRHALAEFLRRIGASGEGQDEQCKRADDQWLLHPRMIARGKVRMLAAGPTAGQPRMTVSGSTLA